MTFNDIRPVNQDILFDGYGNELGISDISGTKVLQVDVVQSVPAPISGTVTADQGAKTTVDNAWPVLVSDGYGNTININHSGRLLVDTQGSTRTIQQAIAEGLADGSIGHRYGYVATSATSQKVVQGTTYTEQSSTGQRSVKSGNANDTSAGT